MFRRLVRLAQAHLNVIGYLILSAGVLYGFVVNERQDRADQDSLTEARIASCQQANLATADDNAKWQRVLDQLAMRGESSVAFANALRPLVTDKFRDCSPAGIADYLSTTTTAPDPVPAIVVEIP